jgi:hypothetical protein
MDSDEDTLSGGLPHSEIPGSTIARISPGLFAACHVLHRLSVPRHPPDALPSRLRPHPTARTIRYGIISTKTFGKPTIPFRVQRNPDGADTVNRHGCRPLLDHRRDHAAPRSRCNCVAPVAAALRRNAGAFRLGHLQLASSQCPDQHALNPPWPAQPGFARDCRPQTLFFAKVPAAHRPPISIGAPASPATSTGRFQHLLCKCLSRPIRRCRFRRCEATPVVEVNGIEPMTSCLQSRRSPN